MSQGAGLQSFNLGTLWFWAEHFTSLGLTSSSGGCGGWTTQVLRGPLINILSFDPNLLFAMIILIMNFSIGHLSIHLLSFLNSSLKATQVVWNEIGIYMSILDNPESTLKYSYIFLFL